MKPSNSPTVVEDRVLTENETAALTGFSPRTLQTWRQRNIGPPFIRAGRSIRYMKSKVIAWLQAQTCETDTINHDRSRPADNRSGGHT